jgi:hypothetical protein
LRAVAEAAVGLPITLVLDNARYQKCALVQTLAWIPMQGKQVNKSP